MAKDKIDVIIPAYKANGTIIRCLSSIACQTIIGEVSVTIVNDCCPEGDYNDTVKMFSPVMDVREIRTPVNSGPGAARQLGIDSTDGEFFTCIDADDMLATVKALEMLRSEIQSDATCMCVSSSFYGLGERSKQPEKLCRNMVWMFGKIYRRSFIEKYKIRFSDTRANEDSGFNHIVKLLCDSPEEQIKYVEENLYSYNDRPESITRIGNGQYYYDQGLCGGIDNMIYAIEHVKKYRPFSGLVISETVGTFLHFYFAYVNVMERAPEFSIPVWEYVKKFYHTCYKPIESFISDETFRHEYTKAMYLALMSGEAVGIIPKLGIMEFMNRLRKEPYDPNLINEIREEMSHDPQYQEIMQNNIACGVCPDKTKEEVETDGIQI